MKLNWPGCVGVPAWPGFLRCMGWETVVSLKSTIGPENNEVQGENYIGCLEKELGWFKPKYNIDFNGWHVEGDFPGWDYTITKPVGETVATVSKELLQWTDTYVLDIVDPADALHVLMFVLAIDAEKCSAK